MKNMILPSSPFFEMIVAGAAAGMIGKVAKTKKAIRCAFEVEFSNRAENDNLTFGDLPEGTIGFIIDTANPKTVLRFLIADEDETVKPGVYHVKYIDLELLTDKQENDKTKEET